MQRREFLGAAAAAAAGATAALALPSRAASTQSLPPSTALSTGRLKQSVSRWPYSRIPLGDFCRAVAAMGLTAMDLLYEDEWDTAHSLGLTCSMGYPSRRRGFIETGFSDRANHPMLLAELERIIPIAAAHGVPNVIAMFGNRDGRSDEDGITACVAGLTVIKPLAEQHRVTVCVELLNSKVDHRGYQGDHTEFGVRVMRAVNSPYVKLLYDIYHMQIMEGDVIRTIRTHRDWIGHFHTGGVPGRHELDDSQELNWRGIARAIADTGFAGYVAHEFVPTRDPLTSLREAVATCDV